MFDKSLILTNEDCKRIDNWWQNVTDEDGDYNETPDRIFLERFKKVYPRQYEEIIEVLSVKDEEDS